MKTIILILILTTLISASSGIISAFLSLLNTKLSNDLLKAGKFFTICALISIILFIVMIFIHYITK